VQSRQTSPDALIEQVLAVPSSASLLEIRHSLDEINPRQHLDASVSKAVAISELFFNR